MNLGPSTKRNSEPSNRLGSSAAARLSVPLSWIYGTGRLVHRAMYRSGIKRRGRLPRPVLCVGNLSVGGTGKTPMIIMLARYFESRGCRPAILSRGYGAGPPAGFPRVVSDGTRPICTVAESGDEPAVMARRCPGVPIVIGANRYDAGCLALEAFEPGLFLLDDGFQHEALERDLDVVLWDLRDVPSRMAQLPAGRLREGLHALRRASALVLTHAEYLDEDDRLARIERVTTELKSVAPRAPLFEADSCFRGYREVAGDRSSRDALWRPMSDLAGQRAVLLSGLARHEGFELMIRRSGIQVAHHLRYGDHARYDERIVETITRALDRHEADQVLTTEKDAVKLEVFDVEGIPIHAAGLEMRVKEPERWEPFLEAGLSKAPRKKTHDPALQPA